MGDTVTLVQFLLSKVSPWTRFARSSQAAKRAYVTRASIVSKRTPRMRREQTPEPGRPQVQPRGPLLMLSPTLS